MTLPEPAPSARDDPPRRALAELAAADSPAVDPRLRSAFAELVRRTPAALHREGGPVHLTASALVVDASGEHVALVWHRKGRFWVQPGGHIEHGETSFEAAARREAEEETGLGSLQRVGPGPAMLHAHTLSESFGRCREHWDVQYLFRAAVRAQDAPLRTSDETPEAIWVPWPRSADGLHRGAPALPEGTVPDLGASLAALSPLVDALRT